MCKNNLIKLYLPIYLLINIYQVLDQRGVGELVKIATERGRKARPNLKVSIALEDTASVASVVQNSSTVPLTD
jgi:pyruvate,orthophosphate dikinase